MRMTQLDGFKKESILNWAQQHVTAGSHVVFDGLFCFRAVETAGNYDEVVETAGSYDEAIVTGGPECVLAEVLPRLIQ
jgi:hypothetical protein